MLAHPRLYSILLAVVFNSPFLNLALRFQNLYGVICCAVKARFDTSGLPFAADFSVPLQRLWNLSLPKSTLLVRRREPHLRPGTILPCFCQKFFPVIFRPV
jgi:hypothetical protein